MTDDSRIQIYQTKDGETRVDVRFEKETVWLTQRQMGEVFDTTPENVIMHLKNIYETGELDQNPTTKDFLVVQTEGKRQVKRRLKHYNLDAVISVGYRVNSKRGVQFRIWATKRLREYLVQGYAVNRERFKANAAELKQALALIQKTAQSPALATDMGRGLIDIMGRYTQTFLWLQQYDEGLLKSPEGIAGGVLPSSVDAMAAILELKKQLIVKGEASDLFARLSRPDSIEAIFGNLDQTVMGAPAYPTIESKAAHLLYFVVKNHPFVDGNKRSGAFLFVDFLHRNNRLITGNNVPVINDTGLAALTLLVAESDPKQKETLIKLVMNLLCENKLS
ncbi:Fic/DOC family protein [Desulfocicer vacuolatum DSM 3385]|uniref:Fic/DOC family protein n=1 Tax=Desulfocicer vacuolatum DSM 3385 TaxID=1121400 RepID=A0A1W2EVY5_9BACT|nr:virulence protein RhuM/Fic/DOC family protein [Desulfocicer vacuolatum]SMD13712.1 Fic/DOC family protein [Desulfocicer vacuolatum DSM 3385]